MRRRTTATLDKMDAQDAQAKAKVALVITVLSGEKSISAACKETGLKPLTYYKLEERMIRAMLMAAKVVPKRGRRSPIDEAGTIAAQTEELRKEHRRMQSLLRVSRKLLGTRKSRAYGPRKAKMTASTEAATPTAEPTRKPGRSPMNSAGTEEIRRSKE